MEKILISTAQHLQITLSGVLLAVAVGIMTGIAVSKHKRAAGVVMAVTDVIQTVPSLALLAMLMMIFGLGDTTVIVALFLYSLLPIVRNTYVGLSGVDGSLVEAGTGMGMSRLQLMVKVKLPSALPMMISGVRVALVTALGIAAMGVWIGAGGLGSFIYRGVQTDNGWMILSGAIPISALAIGTDQLLAYAERNLLRGKSKKKGRVR